MKTIRVTPKKLSGKVNVPPSQRIAPRAVICASLASGTSVITNISFSDDILATINAMRLAGAEISVNGNSVTVVGIKSSEKLNSAIDCNESGSTLRFLIPVMTALFSEACFMGKGRLGKRPLDVYYDVFNTQNIGYSVSEDPFSLSIKGKLSAGVFHVPGNISSQFITGLLFALPLLNSDSEIVVTSDLESKGYIDLTIQTMKAFGVTVINDSYTHFLIKGNQKYSSNNYTVEGDYSQAAFFEVANFIGNDLDICGVDQDSLQGDKQILEILETLKTAQENDLVVIDGAQCPDIIPIAAVAACLRKGKTRFINVGRLKLKESDRLSAVAEELSKIGGNITATEDSLVIDGVDTFYGAVTDSHNDHRIAMMLAIAATHCTGDITINGYECVSKSYPDFFEVYKSLGGDLCEQYVGE